MTDTLSAGPDAACGSRGEGGGARPAGGSAQSEPGSDSDPDGSSGPARADRHDPSAGPPAPLGDALRPEAEAAEKSEQSEQTEQPTPSPVTPREAAVWYADVLGWPVTPAAGRVGEPAASSQAAQPKSRPAQAAQAAQVSAQTSDSTGALASILSPGPWLWAASAAPRLVEAVWQRCPDAPILAVLGRAVPGAAGLGAVDVPALVGAAALERLGRVPGAAGPVADGHGRILFLVDLGPDGGGDCPLERWREAGVDLWIRGPGEFCPLPTPGARGPKSVVWAVPPDPDRAALPAARVVTEVLDRAVRDAYPALWNATTVD
ncbi:MAG TPA: hypothetical protein VGM10_23170 [Actinocrinis sp.]|jgi:hypothetical protein